MITHNDNVISFRACTGSAGLCMQKYQRLHKGRYTDVANDTINVSDETSVTISATFITAPWIQTVFFEVAGLVPKYSL